MRKSRTLPEKCISALLCLSLTFSALLAAPELTASATENGTGEQAAENTVSATENGAGDQAVAENSASAGKSIGTSGVIATERLSTNYTHVSAGYTAPVYTGADIVIRMETCLDPAYADFLTQETYDYDGGEVADVAHGDSLILHVDVPETALYRIGFDYLSYDASILPIELSFGVDGDFPFYEARSLAFETTWVSEGEADIDRYEYAGSVFSVPIAGMPCPRDRWPRAITLPLWTMTERHTSSTIPVPPTAQRGTTWKCTRCF